MGLPNEYSLECERCKCFNIQNGVIVNGEIYCNSCIKEMDDAEVLLDETGSENE